jgi:hypothetical protein
MEPFEVHQTGAAAGRSVTRQGLPHSRRGVLLSAVLLAAARDAKSTTM